MKGPGPPPCPELDPDREFPVKEAHLLKWQRLGLEREKERPREMGQGQDPGREQSAAGLVGRQEQAGQPDPAEMSPHNRKHLITYLWFGQGPGAA